jgi:nitrite reductase/ring-hydroxylating ferredoxin subunit
MTDRIKVAEVDELEPGDRKHVGIKGREITVLNVDGSYYAVENFCPHMGGPVGNGPLLHVEFRDIILCPLHEWLFDLDSGNVVFPIKQRVMSYDCSLAKYSVDVEQESNEEHESGVYIEI